MAITEQCKAAMIEHGVLMKDGVPAGAELMKKDVLKVALIDAGEDGQFPEGFVTDELKDSLQVNADSLNYPGRFPDGIEDSVRNAIGYWFEGEVVFVGLMDKPDVQVFAYTEWMGFEGFASFPVHDNSESQRNLNSSNIEDLWLSSFSAKDRDQPLIGVSVKNVDAVKVEEVTRHEFGHSIGVMHPHDAVGSFKKLKQPVCNSEEVVQLDRKENDGIMAYGEPVETWYDRGTRELVQGQFPVSVKP